MADRGLHGANAFALEEAAQLAIDRRDALGPRVRGQCGGTSLDRPVEVVQRVEDLEPERVNGSGRRGGALLLDPALEVDEFGPLALETGQVLLGVGLGLVAFGGQPLDVGQKLGRRDVDIGDALFGACSVRHGGGSGPRVNVEVSPAQLPDPVQAAVGQA